MASEKKAELLPCPFCGDHAETDFIPEHHSYAIECHSIGCAARIIKETAADAIEAWNRRAPLVPDQSIIEAVDGWFARNTALGGCSDKDVAELAAIFAAAPHPPEVEENPLHEQLDEALQSLEFYKRRCDLLQSIQPRMRDQERTMVCDVLANGHLLQSGDGQPDKARYAPPEAAPVVLPEPVANLWQHGETGRTRVVMPDAITDCDARWQHVGALYTEHQVCELLAAHGICKKET